MTSRGKSSIALSHRKISRRGFLAAGLAATALCFLPGEGLASVSKAFSFERALSLDNIHTGEKMRTIYWQEGAYLPEALAEINYLLRDFRTGEVKDIDTDLLDLLFALQRKLDSHVAFDVISGYRSPETNSLLHSKSDGVAKNSLHTLGMAIDIRLPGYELKTLRSTAIDLRRGGVGYYPKSDFVHVDIGRIRYW